MTDPEELPGGDPVLTEEEARKLARDARLARGDLDAFTFGIEMPKSEDPAPS